jgi:hypothetical protein
MHKFDRALDLFTEAYQYTIRVQDTRPGVSPIHSCTQGWVEGKRGMKQRKMVKIKLSYSFYDCYIQKMKMFT